MSDDKKSRLMADLFGDKSAEPAPAKQRTMLDDILSGKPSGPAPTEAAATPPRQRTMLDDILSGKPSTAGAEPAPGRQRGMFDDLLSSKPSAAPAADATPSRPRSMFDDMLSSKPAGEEAAAGGDVSLGGYEPSASRTGRRGRQRAPPADPLDLFSPKPPSSPARTAPAAAAPASALAARARPAEQPVEPAPAAAPPAAAAAAASWMDSLGMTPAPAAAPEPAPPPPQPATARRELFPPDSGALAAREKELTEEWTAKLAEANKQIAERDSEIVKLKSGCTGHEMEKQRLEEHIALLKRMAEDERRQLEESYQHRLATAEESYRRREKQLTDENNRLRDEFRDRMKRYQEETSWAASSHLRHLSTIEGVQSAELGRLRATYEESLAGLRGEHETVVARLTQLRDTERDAAKSAGQVGGMLDDAIQQLQRTSDVTEDLLARVSHKYDVTLQARETLLIEKEKQLKDTETKLERLQKDTASEREHLQDLITKLQHNLDSSSAEAKEATLRLQQQQARVEARESALDKERASLLGRVEQERHQIERLRQELLEEQKLWLQEVNAERHEIAAAHARLDARLRIAGLERAPGRGQFVPDHQPTLAELDGMYRALVEERTAVSTERDRLAALQAEAKQAVLAADSREQAMSRELERLQSQAQLLKLKSQEVEDVSELAVRSRDEGRRALEEAHQLRQQLTKSQLLLERQQAKLKAQERLLAQERLQLSHQRQSAAAGAADLLGSPARPSGPPDAWGGGERTLGDGAAGGPELIPVDPAVLLWKLRADEDREFLDREAAFLKQLTSPS
ncbi:fas-binding factor 1-like [Amphibalanus amphitrite]|uniref:fas-binding factor 1-like n=1 Tax=Amphibalanus amphitrite TaxID=1232801 RepID=UPI001C9115F6|nr:fas-binding factor 1-like [Amphibalanus amphitrite]XP_043216573.1 fas-binding factor 1-like [Amphibalanus amphitrite]XP_043216574.1 fas-binding factor 1-like [Amphibalanus amphitrite]XP_043216575.1 fas-binding factor 1-like [Amphibalanus amphitrite]